jgi:hypothetical protein
MACKQPILTEKGVNNALIYFTTKFILLTTLYLLNIELKREGLSGFAEPERVQKLPVDEKPIKPR